MEPFYFKSYDRIVGKAETHAELLSEMKRLENTDPYCVEYHVREEPLLSLSNGVIRALGKGMIFR